MNNFDAFFSIAAAVGILAIFYGPWQDFCADFCRQIIFEQREKLFDLAADGRLNFESEEYRSVRSHLEKTIRYSHEITLFQFVLHQATSQIYPSPKGEAHSLSSIRRRMPLDTKKEVDAIVNASSKALVISMGARSMLVLIFLLFALPVSKLGLLKNSLPRKMGQVQRAVQAEVEHASS